MNRQQRVAYGNLWLGIGIILGALIAMLSASWLPPLLVGGATIVFSAITLWRSRS